MLCYASAFGVAADPILVMLERALQFASRKFRLGAQNRATFLISVATCAFSVALYAGVYLRPHSNALLQFFANIELKTLDLRFQLRGKRSPGPAVVIVAIDQKSEDVLGRWPFPRSYFAQALDFLREAQARVIAFDISFPQPDANSALGALQSVREDYNQLVAPMSRAPAFESELKTKQAAADNDRQFADALSRYDNAVLGYFVISPEEAKAQNQERLKQFLDILSYQAYPQIVHPEYVKDFAGPDAQGLSPDLPQFAANAKNFGFFDIVPDPDGIVRREPAVLSFQGNLYPSLDVAAVLAYTNNSLDRVKLTLNPSGVESIVLGDRAIPVDRQGSVQLDYDGPQGTFPTYSLADVVRHKLPPEDFRGRLVLIGPTILGISSTAITPFPTKQFPGVEVHANVMDDILYQHFVSRGPREFLADLAFLLLFSLGAAYLFSILSPLRATLLLAGSLVGYFGLTYFLFSRYLVWIADFLPMTTLALTNAGIVSYRFFFEEAEKRRVFSAFSQYMHPALIRQMLSRGGIPRLGGEEKVLTAMFADIRGFTTLSEGLSPSHLVDLLNEYFSEMTEVIFKNWGTLDKYIGDAIMAYWGAPYPQDDHAIRACRAALEMFQTLQRMQAAWKAKGMACVDMGIGINTGAMLFGNMGSKRRYNFSVIGDSVNLASRLEGTNRQFGTGIIISEATLQQVKGQVVVRELDLIRVRGKRQPVKVYELLGLAGDSDRYADLIGRFEDGLEAYRRSQWEAAIEIFNDVARDHPQDGPTHIFLSRCRALLEHPPEGAWDGVFVMRTK